MNDVPDRPHLVALPSLDALYEAAPEGFVAARTALVGELRAAGDRAAATEVSRLRRPTVPAWALNCVARSDAAAVDDVFDAAEAVAAAMQAPGDHDVRAVQRQFRTSVEVVVDRAVAVLVTDGRTPGPAFRQTVATTLAAAVADPAVAHAVRCGVLATDPPAPGFAGSESAAGDEPHDPPDADAPTSRPAPDVTAGRPAESLTRPARIGGRRRPAAAPERPRRSGPGAAPTAQDAAELAEAKAAARRRQALIAELQADAHRLERRSARLDATAERAEAEAREARTEAEQARTELDAVRAALDAARRIPPA